ncbi:helix-turn-helix domain-containing protein [Streptomyces sp. NPDC018029]|uniref:helix-turn-helix domain-containing protein n=1 Tax=Streptomyces sp. NPDC018029 TaxID=3365032 RepID=UPI0037A8DC68
MKRGQLPDPAQVSSPAGLAAAAKALVAALGLKQNQVAQRSELSEGTISGLFKGRSCPREDTFERFITEGCRQPWKPWHEAWVRASSERRRPSSHDLAAEVEELRARVEELESVVDDLSATVRAHARTPAQAEGLNDWARQSRRQQGAQFLATVGPADFHVVSGLIMTVVRVAEVDAFLGKVKELALQDMAELSVFVLTHAGSFSPVLADEHWDTGYEETTVDAYVRRLRHEVVRHLGGPALVAEAPSQRDRPARDPWAEDRSAATLPAMESRSGWGSNDEPPF